MGHGDECATARLPFYRSEDIGFINIIGYIERERHIGFILLLAGISLALCARPDGAIFISGFFEPTKF